MIDKKDKTMRGPDENKGYPEAQYIQCAGKLLGFRTETFKLKFMGEQL